MEAENAAHLQCDRATQSERDEECRDCTYTQNHSSSSCAQTRFNTPLEHIPLTLKKQVLSSWSKSQQQDSTNRQRLFSLLRRWKHVDIVITESFNEAKDNVKYLFTLEKFLEPLYKGSPSSVIDTLPPLMNSIKMIHTIARYYNTKERMTNLFVKITNQMITCCRKHILDGQVDKDASLLWDNDAKSLCEKLDICLKLNDSYQEHYRLTKDKLLTMPKGKQFDFSESAIFGKLDLFCRRITKLIDMFSTIQQFRTLASHKLEGWVIFCPDLTISLPRFERKDTIFWISTTASSIVTTSSSMLQFQILSVPFRVSSMSLLSPSRALRTP